MDNSNISRYKPFLSLAFLVVACVFAASTGAVSVPTNGLQLIDLTDDESNRAGITATNDNLRGIPGTAFDNDQYQPSNNGRFGGNKHPLSVTYEFVSPRVVNGYRIWNQHTGGYDPVTRAPKTFYVEGSPDGIVWNKLDEQTNETVWDPGEPRYYVFTNSTAYKLYRFTITANNGNAYSIIQELEYFYVDTSIREFIVTGVPGNFGDVSPDYGSGTAPLGETVTCTASPVWTNEAQNTAAKCIGYTFYTNSTGLTGDWFETDSGTGNEFTFTQPDGGAKIEWKFDAEFKVAVDIRGRGTVSGSGWYTNGAVAVIAAEPESPDVFSKWTGDVAASLRHGNPLSLTVDSVKNICAVIEAIRYVSMDGDDANDGQTEETAFRSITNALSSADGCGGAYKIIVNPGTYTNIYAMYLTNEIRIAGATGRPEDVVITQIDGNGNDARVLIMSNSAAFVESAVIQRGHVFHSKKGGNIWIQPGGGTVSNCIIRGGFSTGYEGSGGGVYMDSPDAYVTHCVITNCWISDENSWGGTKAGGVHLTSGRIENSLIAFCGTTGPINTNSLMAAGGIVCGKKNPGGNCSVVNCTVITNRGTCAGGILIVADGTVSNTVIAANYLLDGIISQNPSVSGATNNLVNCATDSSEAFNETCVTGTIHTLFKDFDGKNYVPQSYSVLIDGGVMYEGIPASDLAGRNRLDNQIIDIGCFEGRFIPVGTMIIVM